MLSQDWKKLLRSEWIPWSIWTPALMSAVTTARLPFLQNHFELHSTQHPSCFWDFDEIETDIELNFACVHD